MNEVVDMDVLKKLPGFQALKPEVQQQKIQQAMQHNASVIAQQQRDRRSNAFGLAGQFASATPLSIIDWQGLQQGKGYGEVAGELAQNLATAATLIPGFGELEIPAALAARSPAVAGAVSKLLPAASRIAASAFGGGVKGALTPGESAKQQAGLMGAGQAIGEAAFPLASAVTRRIVQRGPDLTAVTKAVGDMVPPLQPYLDQGTKSFTRLFRLGKSAKILGKWLEGEKANIGAAVGKDTPIEFPALDNYMEAMGPKTKVGLTFKEVDGLITDLQKKARRGRADVEGYNSDWLRDQARKLSNGLTDALDQIQLGLGERYLNARRTFYRGKTLEKMFQEKGVIDPHGRIDMTRLQQVIQEPPSETIRRRLAKEGVEPILNAAGRGDIPVGTDIAGEFPIFFHSGHLLPSFRPPSLPHAIGPNAVQPPQIPAGLLPLLIQSLQRGQPPSQ